MILFLNTAAFEQLHFALIVPAKGKKPGKVFSEKKQRIIHPETEKALEYLDKFLRAAKIKPAQLAAINIVSGPGSFTGIRAGFAHALALSAALDIPVYSLTTTQVPKNLAELGKLHFKKLSADFNPEYGAKPNITLAK